MHWNSSFWSHPLLLVLQLAGILHISRNHISLHRQCVVQWINPVTGLNFKFLCALILPFFIESVLAAHKQFHIPICLCLPGFKKELIVVTRKKQTCVEKSLELYYFSFIFINGNKQKKLRKWEENFAYPLPNTVRVLMASNMIYPMLN